MKRTFFLLMLLLVTAVIQAHAQGTSMSNPINAGSYSSSGSYYDTENSASSYFTNNYGNAANDVWYSFTLNSTASNVVISLCGSSFDTYLHVLNSSGTEIANNDDNGPACSGVQSSINIGNMAPGTYYVDAEGYGSNAGTLDFALTVTMTSPPNISYPSGTHTYTVGTAVSPLSPTNTGGAVSAVNQVLTFAGTGSAGSTDGSGTAASFNQSLGMAMDAAGNMYVADAGSHLIRKVTPVGVVTTLAGGGYAGYTNGTGTAALFNHPVGLALDASGNIYVADEVNNVIRKITPAGVVTTLAGSGSQAYADGTGTAASFYYPCGVAVDHQGNVYVADTYNQRIRKITPTGVVTTLAGSGTAGTADGTGTAASFSQPFGLTIDPAGSNLYVTDRTNQRIRKITLAGVVTTFAGSTSGYLDGTGTAAQLQGPTSITADAAGNLYFTDETNQRIRKITTAGVVSTIAGTGSTGTTNGVGTAASFYNPFAIVAAPAGDIFVSDQYGYLIRQIIVSPYSSNPLLPAGLSIDPSSGTISGTPTTASSATSYTITAYNALGQTGQTALSIAVGNGSPLNLSNMNYIVTYTPRDSLMTTTATVYAAATDKTQMETDVQYFDGLGRPVQTIQVRGSFTGRDVVQPTVYDQYGREAATYLPYSATIANSDGSYKTTAITDQASFYNNPTSWNATGVVTISTDASTGITPSYTPASCELSPLGRLVEDGAPGAAWQLSSSGISGSGHTVKTSYGVNGSNEVILWVINSAGNGAAQSGYYAAGTLYKTIITDAAGNNIIEYKDLLGHIVCKMVQNGSVYLATYYIYDDYDNLAYVIPPIPSASDRTVTSYPSSFLETDALFLNYIYGYHYDLRNRLIEKNVPGKGWEYMIYNSLDQLVITQDANQRNLATQQACYTSYDAHGRVVMTGTFPLPGSSPGVSYLSNMQSQVAAMTTLWETPVSTGNGYTTATLPSGFTALTTKYYDNYNFPGPPSTCTRPVGASSMTAGLMTASLTAVLNSPSTTLWAVNYYDDRHRVIQAYKQHYLAATASPFNYNVTANTYDFANDLTGSILYHYVKNSGNTAAVQALTVGTGYSYDFRSRKISTTKAIATGTNALPTPVILSQEDYNEIGQLMDKKLHSINSGTSFLQEADYAYNERGWLTGINNPNTISSYKLFGEQLTYNSGSNPQYNGNISGTSWQTLVPTGQGLSQMLQSYSFTYDNLNRLTLANYTTTGASGKFNERPSYDVLGNMISLTRTNSTIANQYLNSFTYDYTSQGAGNLLYGVSDAGTAAQASSFTYDANGNVLSDSRRAITNITYNLLNLPQLVTRSTGGNITYVYDATGEKLEKISGSITRDYIDGIEYNNGAIEFVPTEEGRATPNGSSYSYQYYLKDHLGNTRAVVQDNGSTVQVQDYYPFGMDMPNNTSYISGTANQFKYNGKELQVETGEYDYGARFYDPVIARWAGADPMAESNQLWSPYNYGSDNPVLNIDPDGMDDGAFGESIDQMQAVFGVNNVVSINLESQSNKDDGKNPQSNADQMADRTLMSAAWHVLSKGMETCCTTLPDATATVSAPYYPIVFTHMTYEERQLVLEVSKIENIPANWPYMGAGHIISPKPYQDKIDGFYPEIPVITAGVALYSGGSVAGLELATDESIDVFSMKRVGSWMPSDEYEALKSTGQMGERFGGQTSVSYPASPTSYTAARPGWVYTEFDVEAKSLLQGGRWDWFKTIGPNAPGSMQSALFKQGGELLPKIVNLSEILLRK